MKNIIAIIALILTSSTLMHAQGIQKKLNFKTGDVICSSNGKLFGGELYPSKEVSAPNFVGVFNEIPVTESTRRDEVFVSKGVMEVNTSSTDIAKGDYVTTGADGKAVKATKTGFVIGVATEDARDGKVKVALTYEYVVIK